MPGCSSPPVISASSDEPLAADRVVGVLLEDLLQRHLAVQLGVEGHEHLAQPAPRVRPQQAEPLAVAGGRADRQSCAVRSGSYHRQPRWRGRSCSERRGRASPRSRARPAPPGWRGWSGWRGRRPGSSRRRRRASSRWTAASASTAARLAPRRGRRGRRGGRPGSWTCRGSRPGRRRRAGPGRSGRSEARAIRRGDGGRRRRSWHGSDRRSVERAQAPASGAGPGIESHRADYRKSAMHLHPCRESVVGRPRSFPGGSVIFAASKPGPTLPSERCFLSVWFPKAERVADGRVGAVGLTSAEPRWVDRPCFAPLHPRNLLRQHARIQPSGASE